MEITDFLDLGISGAMILALIWVVRAFLAHLVKKDEVFSTTINNHLNHDLQAKEKLTASNDNLTKAVDKLIEKL